MSINKVFIYEAHGVLVEEAPLIQREKRNKQKQGKKMREGEEGVREGKGEEEMNGTFKLWRKIHFHGMKKL